MSIFSNVIDQVVSTFSPEAGLRRAAARHKSNILNSGYSNYGASSTKKSMLGWNYAGGSAREDLHDNLDVLRERCRDLYMGVPLATGAIKTMRTNVIGRGLKLKSTIDHEAIGISEEEAKNLETKIEREFALWAESNDCDLERIDNFYELQQLAFMNWLLSGDVLILLPTTKRVNMPYDLRVQLIEADRLSTPNEVDSFDGTIVRGVEVNKIGEVIAYHISNHHPLSYEYKERKWTRIEAYGTTTGRQNVIHIMSRERIGQRRGVPFLSPVIESLKQLGRYTDAELVAAVISGMFTVFIEKTSTSEGGTFGEMIPENQQVDSGDDSTLEMAPGAILDLAEGEKANAASPGRPNPNFDGFVVSICRQIGAALEIPYELLVKHFTSSYSASRGALEEAWKMFRMYREWMAKDFCQPVFEEWLSEAVAKGRVKAPGFFLDPLIRKAYCKADWNGPARGLLNPVQEVSAAEKRVKNGFSTRAQETMEITGGDYNRNVKQLKQEEKMLREVAEIVEATSSE